MLQGKSCEMLVKDVVNYLGSLADSGHEIEASEGIAKTESTKGLDHDFDRFLNCSRRIRNPSIPCTLQFGLLRGRRLFFCAPES